MVRPKVLLSVWLVALILGVSARPHLPKAPKCREKGQSCTPEPSARHFGHAACCTDYECRYGKHGRNKYLCYAKKRFVEFDPPFANCSAIFTFPLPQPRGADAFEELFKPCEPLLSEFSLLIYTPFCVTDCHGRARKPLRYMRDSQFGLGVPVSQKCVRKALPYIYPFADGHIPFCKDLAPGQAPATQISRAALRVLSTCSGKHVTAGAFQFLSSDASKADDETCVVV